MPTSALAKKRRDDDRLDRVFSALADPTRRAILARVAKAPVSVSDLAAPFAMSLPAVSKHLGVLERAGLAERTLSGRVRHCSFNAAPLRDASAWLDHYRAFWGETLDALAAFVSEAPAAPTRARRRR